MTLLRQGFAGRGGYCAECNNTGEVECHCGGDLCVCGEDTLPCPVCDGRCDDDDVAEMDLR